MKKKHKVLNIKITEDLHTQVKVFAATNKTNVTEVVVNYLECLIYKNNFTLQSPVWEDNEKTINT